MIELTCTHTTLIYSDWAADARTEANANFADALIATGSDDCIIGVSWSDGVGWRLWRIIFHFEKDFPGYMKIDDSSPTIGEMTLGVLEPADNSLDDRDEVRAAFMYDMNTASGDNVMALESWNDFGHNTQSDSCTFNTFADPMLRTITWPTSTDTHDNRTNRFKIEDYLNRTDQTHLGIMFFGAQDWNALDVAKGGTYTEPDGISQMMKAATHTYSDTAMRPKLKLNISLATQRPMF